MLCLLESVNCDEICLVFMLKALLTYLLTRTELHLEVIGHRDICMWAAQRLKQNSF